MCTCKKGGRKCLHRRLLVGIHGHNGAQVHRHHVLISSGQNGPDDDAIRPLRWMEGIPKRIFISVWANVRHRCTESDPVVRSLPATRHFRRDKSCFSSVQFTRNTDKSAVMDGESCIQGVCENVLGSSEGLPDEIVTVIGDIVLEASSADGHQEVVVDEVVTAKGNEDEGFVHEILSAATSPPPSLSLSIILYFSNLSSSLAPRHGATTIALIAVAAATPHCRPPALISLRLSLPRHSQTATVDRHRPCTVRPPPPLATALALLLSSTPSSERHPTALGNHSFILPHTWSTDIIEEPSSGMALKAMVLCQVSGPRVSFSFKSMYLSLSNGSSGLSGECHLDESESDCTSSRPAMDSKPCFSTKSGEVASPDDSRRSRDEQSCPVPLRHSLLLLSTFAIECESFPPERDSSVLGFCLQCLLFFEKNKLETFPFSNDFVLLSFVFSLGTSVIAVSGCEVSKFKWEANVVEDTGTDFDLTRFFGILSMPSFLFVSSTGQQFKSLGSFSPSPSAVPAFFASERASISPRVLELLRRCLCS
nr:hypothetical protein Iba_chr12bCG22210 [Ipomoea batatas]